MKKMRMRLIVSSILLAGLAVMTGCSREEGTAAAPAVSQPKNETKTSGDWTYRIVITQPGTRSQGRRGELLYKGAALPVPAINDYVETPWGKIYWHGLSVEDGLMLWNDQGWMQNPRPRRNIGKQMIWPQEPANQK